MAQTDGVRGRARKHKVHARCGTAHFSLDPCPDGHENRGRKFTSESNPQKRRGEEESPAALPAAQAGVVGAPAEATPSPAPAVAASPLITPANSPEEIEAMRLRLKDLEAKDKAREEHAAAEASTGRLLPRPAILRTPSEQARAILLGQVSSMIEGAKRDNPNIPTSDKRPVLVTKDGFRTPREILRSIPETEDKKRHDAQAAEAKRYHVTGDANWRCLSDACGLAFPAPTIEQIRRRAKAEPGFQLACPHCGGTRVVQQEAA